MVKFTPGPWEAVDRSEVSGIESCNSRVPFAISKPHPSASAVYPIADVCAFPPSTDAQVESMRANAYLIAAAPLMYKVLEMLLHDPEDNLSEFGELLIQKTLAKARGETK